MNAFDGNHDGFLSPLERADQKEFQFADRNKDSALNYQEFSRVESMYQCLLSDHLRFFSIS